MLLGLSPSCPVSSCIMGGTSDKQRLPERARQVVHPWREAFAEGYKCMLLMLSFRLKINGPIL